MSNRTMMHPPLQELVFLSILTTSLFLALLLVHASLGGQASVVSLPSLLIAKLPAPTSYVQQQSTARSLLITTHQTIHRLSSLCLTQDTSLHLILYATRSQRTQSALTSLPSNDRTAYFFYAMAQMF
ncbi:hypothetical protein BDV95DRAFT_53217 [Massariosphaeria phaeospora]|uniref:Uncharacterized protein n=1 Tax=Massariosphaeria phaeospora TaxID=100035 RepID=A0A7C8ID31_9PLEO|nr:hypothetical protein BDV95DRAFT_53217 [Massariosphaeria phaeospora]